MLINGFDVLEGGAFMDGSFSLNAVRTDQILELRDGQLSKVRRTFDAQEIEYSVEVEAMGESASDESSETTPLIGHTVEITIDEDGEVSVVDVTEGDVELATAETLEGIVLEGTYQENLLPEEPVEIGDSWDLAGDQEELFAAFKEGAMEGVVDDPNAAEIMAVLDIFAANTAIAVTGTLTDVEDGVALIEWSLEASVELDDLVGVIQAIADPEEIGEIPPGVESNFTLVVTVEAQGRFDLELHQLVDIKASGEITLELSAAFSETDMELDANLSLISEFTSGHRRELL